MAKKLSSRRQSKTSFFHAAKAYSSLLTLAISLTVNWWHTDVKELSKG